MTVMLATETATTADVLPSQSMIERMTLIMRTFDRPSTSLTLEEITRRTRLPRSTVHRILDQLVSCRWIIHARNHYVLGGRALGLGGPEIAQHRLRAAASGALHQLALRTGSMIFLGTLCGNDVEIVDRFGGIRPLSSDGRSRVGSRAPAHRTAMGKALLAALEPEMVEALYAERFGGGMRNGINDISTLRLELSKIRVKKGLAHDRGELLPNLACIGAPIRDRNGAVGAVSLAARNDGSIDRMGPILLVTAAAISDRLANIGHR